MGLPISKKLTDVLKTFAGINSNILFAPGNVLKTVSIPGNIYAEAELDVTFDKEFGIYNVSEFLGALSLFKEPVVDFNDRFAKISEASASNSLKYIGASKEVLVLPKKAYKEPEFDLSFDITGEQLNQIQKGASIIGAPDLQIIRENNEIHLRVCTLKNPGCNDFQIKVADNVGDDVSFNLKVDNIRVFPGNQTVHVCSKGITKWHNTDAKVFVCIALEAK